MNWALRQRRPHRRRNGWPVGPKDGVVEKWCGDVFRTRALPFAGRTDAPSGHTNFGQRNPYESPDNLRAEGPGVPPAAKRHQFADPQYPLDFFTLERRATPMKMSRISLVCLLVLVYRRELGQISPSRNGREPSCPPRGWSHGPTHRPPIAHARSSMRSGPPRPCRKGCRKSSARAGRMPAPLTGWRVTRTAAWAASCATWSFRTTWLGAELEDAGPCRRVVGQAQDGRVDLR